jgi:hypothetical protein
VLSLTGVGETPPVVTEINKGLSFMHIISVGVSGTVNYTGYFTQQDPFSSPDGWFLINEIDSLTSNFSLSLTYPVRAIKFAINSGTGSCTFTIEERNE